MWRVTTILESNLETSIERKHYSLTQQLHSLQIIPLSAQFSHSVVSGSLWPHGLQHARPPCPYQLPKFTQTHVNWVGDAIQSSHPLSSPSPPALNLSQHQGLFKWVSSSHQVAKVLEFQLQHQSFQWTPRTNTQTHVHWVGDDIQPSHPLCTKCWTWLSD